MPGSDKVQEAALMAEPQIYEDLVNKAVDPLFAVDPEGRILTWNWGCTLLFGRWGDHTIGRHVQEFIKNEESVEAWRKGLEEAMGTGWAVCDLDLSNKEGNRAHARFVIRSLERVPGENVFAVTVQDRTEIQRLEEQLYHQIWALTESEQRLRNLVPDAVIVADTGGRIEVANELTEHLFGRSPEELVGKSMDGLIPGLFNDHEGWFNEASSRPIVLPKGDDGELYGVRSDGTRFPVEVSLGPFPKADGTVVTTAVRDVTDRVQARRRLAEVERLKEMDRFKANFINTAAHELKTPLTAMKIQLHLLDDEHNGPLDDAQKQHVQILRRNVERFNRLVEDLLDAARVQSDRLYLERVDLVLGDVVSKVIESFRDVAEDAGIELVFQEGAAHVVYADPGRLEQVLYNLLNNAVKFTPQGGKITVSTIKRKNRAVVQVSDTGIGLEQEQIDKLFEPFTQVHEQGLVKQQGTGLGLYLSRRLVELHGGRIWSESQGRGHGATFSFEIPLRQPEDNQTDED